VGRILKRKNVFAHMAQLRGKMPIDVQTLVPLPFHNIAHEKNPVIYCNDPPAMNGGRRQTFVSVMTADKQSEAIPADPFLGKNASLILPRKWTRRFPLIFALDAQRVVHRSTAK
jgi:hypothetical protein